jgi:tRNA threonylcarbamoyladenosine biosynthesis protein TsaE
MRESRRDDTSSHAHCNAQIFFCLDAALKGRSSTGGPDGANVRSLNIHQFPKRRSKRFYTYHVSRDIKTSGLLREITSHSAEETIAFGRTLAELLAPPQLVLLRGELGAGKTTLVKGIAAAFEAATEEDVTSPTFTLVHEYRGPRANLYHIDLYRIDTPRQLETLALDDMRAENSLLLIEWGEKFPRLVRERDVEIALEREGESGRRIRIAR